VSDERQGLPQWPVINPAGDSAGFVRMKPYGAEPNGDEGIWWGSIAGQPERLSAAVPSAPPVLDAAGRRLLAAFVEEETTTFELFHLGDTTAAPIALASLGGSAQQIAWLDDEPAILAVVAEPGSDSASLTSGKRRPRAEGDGGDANDPIVSSGREPGQRLWRVPLGGAPATAIAPAGLCVWEVAPLGTGEVACICSPENGEAAWYSAFVGRIELASGRVETVYRPAWQVMGLAADLPSGRLAFVESWASDRGLVAGEVVILEADGTRRVVRDLGADVTYLQFDSHGRLHFVGWRDLGMAFGVVGGTGVPGAPEVATHSRIDEAASLMSSPWRPSLAVSADGETMLACRSDDNTPREVAVRRGGPFERWVGGEGAPPRGLSVEELSWPGAGGAEIHGLFLQSDSSRESSAQAHRGALVVLIHGGPSLAHHHSFDPHRAHRLLEAGFCVLLANQRGGPGRGDEFARANHRDPGGAELDDVLAGAQFLMSSGRLPEHAPAVMGSSYGGYLSALAAVTRPVACAVVGAGMSDLTSCRNTCNNAPFYDLLLGGAPSEADAGRLYRERSAVYRCDGRVAPTLILHGEDDGCVPVGQAYELYGALRAAGAEVEMAIYPREGHQITEPAHVADYWSRALGWLIAHCAVR
jgi:dipeptidyl aminopeptidase/acylaminoacyl peptidase